MLDLHKREKELNDNKNIAICKIKVKTEEIL